MKGLAASYNAIVIPMINNAKVNAPEKLKLWHQGYELGVRCGHFLNAAVVLAVRNDH